MVMRTNLICCALLLAFFTASAFGATISYTVIANNGGLNYLAGGGIGVGRGTFTLSQFDSALGNLTGVSLTVTGISIGGTNRIDNTSETATGNITLAMGSGITVSNTVDASLVIVNPAQTISGFVDVDHGNNDFTGPDALGLIGTSSTNTQGHIATDVTPYIGLGTILYSFSSSANKSINVTSGDVGFGDLAYDSRNPRFNFTAIVTYTYDASPPQVPEPGTLGMAAVLGSLALARLRRNRRANR